MTRRAARLPIPDFDELPLTSVQHQIRALERDELIELIEHEHAHADRTPVLELLRARLEQLDQGADTSGGDPAAHSERPADTRTGSPVSPDAAAGPSGPLRHGRVSRTPERDRP
ncbi:hypothetical protein SAMN06265360_103180 [Haloechinothrix alba]|uniref:DUF8129 domain-containing protein n=1 Tax=Haloechinothrix alba TaxID=664784 RepID=A0A238VPC7_9PSEU|nr:hypothetical protein [Haloechinothrix alba]SNR36007.1 hypothetical protein SAMN06265360_103180 [Haloechinothrix alba]